MPKYIGVFSLLLCLAILFTGCSQPETEVRVSPLPTATTVEKVPTTAPTRTQAPTQVNLLPTQPILEPTAEDQIEWVLSSEAGDYLGQVKTVRIELSHCAYKPGINGSPTFCNDQPYPDHVFTYLVWGQDWSHFDQACVLVTGEIVEYGGKSQIEVEEEGQIVPCDG
jgi:hypothetical protein